MWLFYAVASAFFAGITSILAKCGIRKTDSTVATAVRTVVILLFSWLIVGIVGSASQITSLDGKTLLFLILRGRPQELPGYVISGRCSWETSTRWFPLTNPARC